MADRADVPFISLPEDEAGGAPARTIEEAAAARTAAARAETRELPPPAAAGVPAEDDPDRLLDRLNQQHRAIEDALRNYGRVAKERDEARGKAAALENELGAARTKLRDLDRTRERQEKLDASMVSLTAENARLKAALGELEQRARALELRATAADASAQSERVAREDAERRVSAALAALQPRR